MSDEDSREPQVAPGSAGVDSTGGVIRVELGDVTELESQCPKCRDNGMTRLMITKIPHFREIIISSFECPHCGEHNRMVQFGGEFGPKKVKFHLRVKDKRDLDRQLVKSDWATLTIPQLDLELGPDAQKGTLNTVEGVLQQVEDGLAFQQDVRKTVDPDLHGKIEAFIERLRHVRALEEPFDLWLEDPAGNSYIESLYESETNHVDANLTRFEVTRSAKERAFVGIGAEEAYDTARSDEHNAQIDRGETSGITEFLQNCPACAKESMLRIHETHIPYFHTIVIMAFKCEFCGYKSNEIKNAGEMPPLGRLITLRVENESDLSRDVLKSDSTQLNIPEIDLEMTPGTLGGFFTTVEGLLAQVYDNLANLRQIDFDQGDSADREGGGHMKRFLTSLNELRSGKKYPFTLVLRDACGMVYVQNPRAHLKAPDNVDPQLEVVDYERTEEEMEELGFQ